MTTITLDEEAKDVLQEVLNIGMGHAAAQLSEIVCHHIALTVPRVVLCKKALLRESPFFKSRFDDAILVSQSFFGNLSGCAHVLFPHEASLTLLNLMNVDSGSFTEINAITEDGLKEIGNTLINACIGAIANTFEMDVQFRTPLFSSSVGGLDGIEKRIVGADDDEYLILVKTKFSVREKEIEGSFIITMSITDVTNMINQLKKYNEGLLA